MPQTINQLPFARAPYVDTDLFAIGYPPNPTGTPPTPTYQGTLTSLAAYVSTKLGTGQLTLVGNNNYVMLATDFELATSVVLTLSPTWTLVRANTVPAGQRRRIVDLAGVIVPGSFQIAVSPGGTDKINGVTGVFWLVSRFSRIILESDGISNWTIVDVGPSLLTANNLSDLPNVSTARTNLGLKTAAIHDFSEFVASINNLSELPSKPTARSNLGLGGLAVLSTVAYSNLDPAAIATLSQLLNGTASKLISSNGLWSSKIPVNILFATAVTWDFNTFLNALYGPLTGNSTVTVTNPKAGQSGFIIIRNGAPSRTLTFPPPPTFTFVTNQTTIGSTINQSHLFEYWCESTSLIRCRLTINIE